MVRSDSSLAPLSTGSYSSQHTWHVPRTMHCMSNPRVSSFTPRRGCPKCFDPRVRLVICSVVASLVPLPPVAPFRLRLAAPYRLRRLLIRLLLKLWLWLWLHGLFLLLMFMASAHFSASFRRCSSSYISNCSCLSS